MSNASSCHTWICLQALEEKEKGNSAYKSKDFEAALEHYQKAIDLDPNNITYYNNRAGKQLPIF